MFTSTNQTVSTLLQSAAHTSVSDENRQAGHGVPESQNAQGQTGKAKVKQSKKAAAGTPKYSTWKPKAAPTSSNDSLTAHPDGGGESTANLITDKTNSMAGTGGKVRKTPKTGEKKKEKKQTIGAINAGLQLLNAAQNAAANSNASNMNASSLFSGSSMSNVASNANSASSTGPLLNSITQPNLSSQTSQNSASNRKSKPPTLISSLLEQQDLLKKQQLQSKLSADSFEQIWEDHCYTPRMPWLKSNQAPPPPVLPPAPVPQPLSVQLAIPAVQAATLVPLQNTAHNHLPTVLHTANGDAKSAGMFISQQIEAMAAACDVLPPPLAANEASRPHTAMVVSPVKLLQHDSSAVGASIQELVIFQTLILYYLTNKISTYEFEELAIFWKTPFDFSGYCMQKKRKVNLLLGLSRWSYKTSDFYDS